MKLLNKILVVCLLAIFQSGIANAVPANKTAGVALISAGTVATGAAAIPIVGAGVGGFQIGWGIGCLLFDPPDTANAGTPVDINDYLAFQFPSAASIDPTVNSIFAATFNSYMNIMDAMVAQSRAARASYDRYQGALLLGLPNTASDRLNEANGFISLLMDSFQSAKANFPSVLNGYDTFYPGVLDEVVTKNMMMEVRDSIAAGVFPAVEQTALSAWGVTNEEKTALSQRFFSLTDQDIDNFFVSLDPVSGNATSFRNALTAGTDSCSTCMVPEPSTILLFGTCIAGLARTLSARRKKGRNFLL